jgi:hypothetical protein
VKYRKDLLVKDRNQYQIKILQVETEAYLGIIEAMEVS